MVAQIPFNYVPTVNAVGAFTVSTNGAVQGTAMDSPSHRFDLRSGVVAYTETLPMWGGVGIYENVPNDPSISTFPMSNFGSTIGRATILTGTTGKVLTGFALFNQTHNAAISTQSNVPLAASGMTFNYARLGSGMQIVLGCDSSLIALENNSVNQQVSWDFNNQILQPFDAATPTYALTSMTWANTNGGQITVVGAVPSLVGGVGDVVFISGATNTGTGGAPAVNGTFVVSAWTDSQHYILAAPAAAGVIGTIAGSPVLNAGVAALPIRLDYFLVGNSMGVNFNPTTGFGSWTYNATVAVVTI